MSIIQKIKKLFFGESKKRLDKIYIDPEALARVREGNYASNKTDPVRTLFVKDIKNCEIHKNKCDYPNCTNVVKGMLFKDHATGMWYCEKHRLPESRPEFRYTEIVKKPRLKFIGVVTYTKDKIFTRIK